MIWSFAKVSNCKKLFFGLFTKVYVRELQNFAILRYLHELSFLSIFKLHELPEGEALLLVNCLVRASD